MAGKRNKRNSVKMAVTYIVTILLTLVIASVVCWYMYNTILNKKTEEINYTEIEQLVKQDKYAPESEDTRTLLLILDAEKRQSATGFMAVRFDPVQEKLVLMPFPCNTVINHNGESDTIYNFYRNGGSTAAMAALSSCINVEFDHYIKFSASGFETIVDIFGGVDFDVPYNIIYSNPDTGEDTIIKEGRTFFDSSTLRKFLTYPDFKSGEEYRAKCLALTAVDMLNANIDEIFATHLDDYFSLVINSDIETDITSYDYEEVSEAMKHVAENSRNPASFVLPTGVADGVTYTLDESFIENIPEWFLLDDGGDIDLDALEAPANSEISTVSETSSSVSE